MSSEHLVREAQDPATTPARLAELAQADRSTWAAIVFNPSAYEGLLQWLGERGDPTVDAALAARAAQAAQTSAAQTHAAQTSPEPTVVLPPTGPAPDATTSFGSVPPDGTATRPAPGSGGTDGKPLAIVIAMVAVIIALIGGAAFGATKVFGGDDDPVPAAGGSSTSESPTPEPGDSAAEPSGSEESEEFCDAMSDLQDASLTGRTDDMLEAYDDLQRSVPSELEGDVDTMAGYLETLQDPTSIDPDDLGSAITDYIDALGRVTEYYAATCF